MNDKYALEIGRHILNAYAEWTANPRGKTIHIPIALRHSSDEPPWHMTIKCDMPWFVETYWENGERKFKHWSLKEWHENRPTTQAPSEGGE